MFWSPRRKCKSLFKCHVYKFCCITNTDWKHKCKSAGSCYNALSMYLHSYFGGFRKLIDLLRGTLLFLVILFLVLETESTMGG